MKTNRHYPTNRKSAGVKNSNSSRPRTLSLDLVDNLAKWCVSSYKWLHSDPCVIQVDVPMLPRPDNTACLNCEDIFDACSTGLYVIYTFLDAIKPKMFHIRIHDNSCKLVIEDVVCVALTLTK